MASAHVSPTIEKLIGRENYNSWKFAMQALLEHEDLWNAVDGTEMDEHKKRKAKSKIILFVDPINYVHIEKAKTAQEAWENLRTAFEDSGLTRKVGLLRKLVTTQLQNCQSIDEYVNTIITTANKLNNIKFTVPDEWVGVLLLAGLPDEYKPMLMGLESSGVPINSDSIKTKLLQDVKTKKEVRNADSNVALYTKVQKDRKMEKSRCYSCNKPGHYAYQCRNEQNKYPKKRREYTNGKNRAFYTVFSTQASKNDESWYIDSCSSHHFTNNENILKNARIEEKHITVANGEEIKTEKNGTVELKMNVHGKEETITVNNVKYAPQLAVNILSVNQITRNGYKVTFGNKFCKIQDKNGTKVAEGKEENGVYKLKTENEGQTAKIYAMGEKYQENDRLWHRRLGHLNRRSMNKLQKLVNGLKFKNDDEETCLECIKGKQHRLPFNRSERKSKEILELIHSDLCGPMETTSIGGSKYFFTLIDDFSRKTFIYFLEHKSDVYETLQDFIHMVEKQTNKKIKKIRTDNGREYVNRNVSSLLKKHGIQHQLTVGYCPEQNGIAERANRTIVEKARTMLVDAKLGKEYWAEAVSTAVHLMNRSPSSVTDETPEYMFTRNKPNLGYLRVFGCKAMVHIPKEKRNKWDSKSEELIFIGYCDNIKGYRLINPETGTITVSRDVIFIENMTNEEKMPTMGNKNVVVTFEDTENENNEAHKEQNSEDENEESEDELETNTTVIEQSPETVRRSERVKKSNKMSDYVYDESEYNLYIKYQSNKDPITVEEALRSHEKEKWMKAMEEEYQSLIKNKTWEEASKKEDQQVLDTKWVFKRKQLNEKEVKYKARLVVRGCKQREGLDYNEVYSPVVRHTSLKLLFSQAAKEDWLIHHMDVNTAYLQGDLEEEIYIYPPEGFEPKENVIYRLKKAIYGLKQSGRAWNKKLNATLNNLEFKQCEADNCVYIKQEENEAIIITVYVDDVLIITKNEKLLNETKEKLKEKFDIKDLGEVRNILGMNITRNFEDKVINIDQSSYIKEILEKYRMADCKPTHTPIDMNQKYSKQDEPKTEAEVEEMKRKPYKEAVGNLLYLTQITRPDIAFATNLVSRFSQNPGRKHWGMIKRIFRYLKGTIHLKLQYNGKENQPTTAYSDADWAQDQDDRKSTTGYVIIKQGAAISWTSKKQQTVANSTTEAEYIAITNTTKEVLWIRKLLKEIDPKLINSPTIIHSDNRSAINLSENEGYSSRTKHMDVRHNFLKENILNKNIEIKYLSTEEMVADPLTKPVSGPKLKKFIGEIGLQP